jgi:hypothetical protein
LATEGPLWSRQTIDLLEKLREGPGEKEPNGSVGWDWNEHDVGADADLERQCSECDSGVKPAYNVRCRREEFVRTRLTIAKREMAYPDAKKDQGPREW